MSSDRRKASTKRTKASSHLKTEERYFETISQERQNKFEVLSGEEDIYTEQNLQDRDLGCPTKRDRTRSYEVQQFLISFNKTFENLIPKRKMNEKASHFQQEADLQLNEKIETYTNARSGVRPIKGLRSFKNKFKEDIEGKPGRITSIVVLKADDQGLKHPLISTKDFTPAAKKEVKKPSLSSSSDFSMPHESSLYIGDGCSSFSKDTYLVKSVSHPSYLGKSFKMRLLSCFL